MPGEVEIQLLVEQLKHALDLNKAQSDAVKLQLDHDRELNALKFDQLRNANEEYRARLTDMETRLRDATAGVIQSRLFIGLVGGSILLALTAIVKAFFF